MTEANQINNIDDYISQYSNEIQLILRRVRQVIADSAPDATERISYRMPCFWLNGPLIYFAAQKNHLGVYPTASGISAFRSKLAEYKTSKGAVQFSYDKPIPYDLIAEITRFKVEEVTQP
ncbi:MAG: DUF1801 domain-containing protein [Coriobacteriia bacterium]|nr:DUF1801 domain-containing protein [Coriobacteriia bacterium]